MATKTTVPAVQDPNLPATAAPGFLANVSPTALAAVADNMKVEPLRPSDLDRIKVPAGGGTSFEVNTLSGPADVKELRGVILGCNPGRAYWKEEFGGDKNPPDCLSLDGVVGVGKPGGACIECPYDQYESATKGKGKACKETRTLAILLDGDLLPTIVRVPPSGLKGWRGYMMRLTRSGLSCQSVVTKLTLAKAKSQDGVAYSEIVFAYDVTLSDEEREAMGRYIESIGGLLEASHKAAVADVPEEGAEGANPFAE